MVDVLLAFSVGSMGSHCWVFSTGIRYLDFYFIKIILAALEIKNIISGRVEKTGKNTEDHFSE